jgi:hypothetical protein
VKAGWRWTPSCSQGGIDCDIEIAPLQILSHQGVIRKPEIGVREMDQQNFPHRLSPIFGGQRPRRYEQYQDEAATH